MFSPRRLQEARLHKGWSQKQLAHAVGKREGDIGRWERGQNEPRANVLAALALALGCSIEFFYIEGESDEDEKEAAQVGASRDLLRDLRAALDSAIGDGAPVEARL